LRGRKKVVKRPLTPPERRKLLYVVILGLIVLAIGMYLGWWSAQQEEGPADHSTPFGADKAKK
jgi:hypothetical protein